MQTAEESVLAQALADVECMREKFKAGNLNGLTAGALKHMMRGLDHLRKASVQLERALMYPRVYPYPPGVQEVE